MKIEKFGLVFVAAAVLFALVSCKSEYLLEPKIPSGSTGKGLPPEGLYASQGEKRTITLSWMPRTDAALYYVYQANSPLDTFVRCGETASNQIKFNTAPGSAIYYRVSSVSSNGTESLQSAYVKGTSLAQPIITDIADLTESSAAVTWYMDNVSDDSYKNNLLYTIYCYNGSAEIAQIALDGSIILENKATFSGLNANTNYEYVVEAYLRSDQSVSEKSDKMDAATARRFRPGPPEMLRATRGTSIDKVVLSFELPDMVDIALGDNQYDPKPVYFVISKRLYSETHANEYQKACSYFGINASSYTDAKTFDAYIPGAFVTWTDTNVERGVAYEYQVQSYVDDTLKVISSDTSKASAEGWALSDGSLSFGKPTYTLNATGDFYESAALSLDFQFDPKGIQYEYVLSESHIPVDEDGEASDRAHITRTLSFGHYDDIRTCTFEMYDLDSRNGQYSDRGLYSYEVTVNLEGEKVDTFATFGLVEITENTNPIVVDNFYVQDGFKDKFVLKWKNQSNMRYTIYQSDDRTTWTEIDKVNDNPSGTDVIENFSFAVLGQTAGTSKYFAIQPSRDISGQTKKGQMVYAQTASQTLGIPQLTSINDTPSYSFVTVTWKEAQKADAYRIKYWYTEESEYETATIANTVNKNALVLDANNRFRYSFQPEGYNDVTRAGLEIQVAVDALNEGLWAAVGGEEIATTSKEELSTHLVGPALLHATASKAASTTDITVTWNSIVGADGYYVYRRQFNMTNTAEAGSEAVVYYVPETESASNKFTGKNLALDNSNSKIDTLAVKATASLAGSKHTLTDKSMLDNDYDGTEYNRHTTIYRDQQNNMAQGYPYRYYVVPVIMRGGVPEPLTAIEFVYAKDGSNKNANIASYTIRENNVDIRYSGAATIEREGFVVGFGQDVVATKGTYISSVIDDRNINEKIKVIWNPPPLLAAAADFSPRYTLYRRASGSSVWETATSGLNLTEYVDTPQTPGVAYEYVVGIGGSVGVSSDPRSSRRFIDLCYTLQDENSRANMLGFILNRVTMNSVSRNEQKLGDEFAEEVRWYSAGIKSSAGAGNNWGIDGYEVFVMNRNIDADWHPIVDIAIANIPDQTDQSVKVTNQMGGGGLLKVMRDYKHYFHVRSYVLHDNEKIYCPEPGYVYAYKWGASATQLETDYVKWGARQVTPQEFAKIAMIPVAWGIKELNGTGWQTAYYGPPYPIPIGTVDYRNHVTANHNGSTGSGIAESSYGVGQWCFSFRDYQPDLMPLADRNSDWVNSVTFLKVSSGAAWEASTIYADSGGAGQYPTWYGSSGNYGTAFFDIKAPNDISGMYTGQIRFVNLRWGSGSIEVKYPATATTVTISGAGQTITPFPYSGQGASRIDNDEWY